MEIDSETIKETALLVDIVLEVDDASEENTQRQEAINDENSDNDSIFGNDSDSENDDEMTFNQTQGTKKVFESDHESDGNDEQNLLLSPSSTKDFMDSSPISNVSKMPESPIEKKYSVKTEKKFKITAPKLTVVESEIQAIKKIESGPSESELRRRNLIEIDQDELEERLDRLQKATLKSITSCTGLTKAQQKTQLRECRQFLSKHLRMEDFASIVEDHIEKASDDRGQSSEDPVDALKYLQRNEDQYSSDEEEEEEDDSKVKTKNPEEELLEGEQQVGQTAQSELQHVSSARKEESKAVIYLSDSEDEEVEGSDAEEELEMEVHEVKVKQVVAAPTPVPVPVKAPVVSELDVRREAYLAKMSKPTSARTALLISLRHKVLETADTTYCNKKKIQSANLDVILQIAEKCRILVDLLKERQATRAEADRVSRRARYQTNASAEDDEFDEDEEDYAEGAFMSDEVRDSLMRQLHGEEEEEEEENNDAWEQQDDDEDLADENAVDVEDEDEGVIEREVGEVNGDDENEEEEEAAVQSGRVRGGGRNVVREEDDEEEGVTTPFSPSSSAQHTRPMVQYGRARPVSADVGAAADPERASSSVDDVEGAEQQDTILDEEQEEETKVVPRKKASNPAKSTGNSMYRLQLEEEDRRVRSRKKSGLLDEEAEEEEEEVHQRGLGDFGFGNLNDMRDIDEEKDALRLRRGDLDHIVDDVSDGEGDEEAAAKARVAMEIREDKARTLAVINAVTEGRNSGNKKPNSFNKLANAGGITKKLKGDDEDGENGEGEDEDEEEMLQRGLKSKIIRERMNKRSRDSDDSDSEDEGDDDDEKYTLIGAENMTEQERLAEEARLQLQREQDKIDASRCKLMERQTKMRRELRRQQASGALQKTPFDSQTLLLDNTSKTFSLDPVSKSLSSATPASGEPVKRRTSLPPRKAPLHGARPPAVHRSNTHSSNSTSDQNKGGLVRRTTMQQQSTSSLHYNGQLNQSERSLGMGMITSRDSTDSQPGLFSAVTGSLKRGASEALPSGSLVSGGQKRSFCSAIKRSSTLSSSGSSSNFSSVQQTVYVFTSETSMHGGSMLGGGGNEHSNMQSHSHFGGNSDNHSRSGFANSTISRAATASSALPVSGNSLFAKLATSGVLKTTKSGGR